MPKLSIVVDAKIPFIKGVLEPYADVVYLEGNRIDATTVKHADALIVRTRTRCDATLLDGSSVRFIATATIGTDHIDTCYCDAHGIAWTNAAGCNSGSVCQYVASVLAWLVMEKNVDLSSLTLGVVGCGHVGSKIARLGRLLKMKVLVNDPPLERLTHEGEFTSLENLLTASDIVTLHTPLTREGCDKTFHLIGEKELAMMKSDAWLINSSRGEVVDGEALYNTLTTRCLAGAVLDVWENEPDISADLLREVSLGTPHIAGYSADGKATATALSVRALSRFFELPLNDWSPARIPVPADPLLFQLDAAHKTDSELFSEAEMHTYNIAEDDKRLRQSLLDFENQRGSYPVRREFQAYTVHLRNAQKEDVRLLEQLGFLVLTE